MSLLLLLRPVFAGAMVEEPAETVCPPDAGSLTGLLPLALWPDNLVPNPSFMEANPSLPWIGRGDVLGDTVISRSSEQAKFGQYSLKHVMGNQYTAGVGNPGPWYYGWSDINIPISGNTAGRVYDFIFWVYVATARTIWADTYVWESGGASPAAMMYPSPFDLMPNGRLRGDIDVEAGWTQLVIQSLATVQSDRTIVQCGFYTEMLVTDGAVYYLDGVQLYDVRDTLAGTLGDSSVSAGTLGRPCD